MNTAISVLAIIFTSIYIIGAIIDDKNCNKTFGYYMKSGAMAMAIYNSFYIIRILLNK